ncbi:MAG: ATP-binding protein [Myxococcota bacterium]
MDSWPIIALAVCAAAGLTVLVVLTLRWHTTSLRRQAEQLNREVSQRRGVEAALRQSHTHYRTVFQSASGGLVIVEDGRIREANPAARALFADDDLVGRAFSDHVPWDSDQGDTWVRCLRSDGVPFYASVSAHVFGNNAHLYTISDVSSLVSAQEQRREMEAELAHTHRLEAIGRLAGGVAHDFNNMLTALAGGAEVLRAELPSHRLEGEVGEVLTDLESVVRRGSQLTGQLLSFGRRQELVTRMVDLTGLIRDLEPMLQRALRDDVVLRISLPSEQLSVIVDPTQLELSLLNLVLNAGEAQPGGGEVRVGLSTLGPGDASLPPLPRAAHQWALVTVADDGIGIPEADIAHVFEPFYSTRDGGTGLGLAAVHGFASQSGGWLKLSSQPGRGSEFRLGLPVESGAPAQVSEMPTPIDSRELMGARVLVVDDNPEVLRVMQRILSRARFDVVATSRPREALALANREVFDLIVTDVIMPELRGQELVRRIRENRRSQVVLFVSAYTDTNENGEIEDPVLHKPFTRNDLLRAVRDVLV